MAIELIRIDDRLIHGQVATQWMKNLAIEQVLVISDVAAKDPLQLTILEIAAPVGVRVMIYDVAEFVDVYNSVEIKRRTLLLFTNPIELLACLKGGLKANLINIGGMKYVPGKKKVTRSVSVSEAEELAFKEIIAMGIEVEIRMMPIEKPQFIKNLL